MSFSAEMKDFLNAYSTGQKVNASRTDQDYKSALTDAQVKKTANENDPETLEIQGKTERAKLALLQDRIKSGAVSRGAVGATTALRQEQLRQLRSGGSSGLYPTGAIQPGAGGQPSPQGALPIGPSTLDDTTEEYADGGLVPDEDQTILQVNVGKKGPKGGVLDPLPNTDDNMFFASGRDEKIIRAKRSLREGLNRGERGELRKYADGGLVDEDTDPNDADDTGAVPLNSTPINPPTDVSARRRDPGVPKGLEGVISPALVADATKAGMNFGINAYGLNRPGALQTPAAAAKARLFAMGHGGLTDQEMDAAKKAVDPEGKLTDSQRNMAALGSVYQFWANKGDGEKASKVAFQMLQHYRNASQRYAAIAAHAAQGGNVDLATKAAMKAYANVPDGNDLELLPNPDGGIMYAVTGPNGDTVTKGIATPQQLAASAMGLATGGFDKAILSAAGASEATGAVKAGGGKPQSATDRAKEAELPAGEIAKLKDKWTAKNKDAPVDEEYWQQMTDTAQHVLQQNPKATAGEAARAAQLLISPGAKDPEKADFKVTPGEEGQPHTVKFGSGLKIKLDDDQLEQIMNARAARVKAATDKINSDMEAQDTPGTASRAVEGAKQLGKGFDEYVKGGGPAGAVMDAAKRVGEGAASALSSIYGQHIPKSVLDAVEATKGAVDTGAEGVGAAIRSRTSNQGAIPVDEGDRPL